MAIFLFQHHLIYVSPFICNTVQDKNIHFLIFYQASARPSKCVLCIILGYDAWCGVAHGCTRKLGMKICGKLLYLLIKMCKQKQY